jgi:hypothetical protein
MSKLDFTSKIRQKYHIADAAYRANRSGVIRQCGCAKKLAWPNKLDLEINLR